MRNRTSQQAQKAVPKKKSASSLPAKPGGSLASPLFISLVLVGVTFAAYTHVLGCDFVNFDDDVYISGNPAVQAGLTWSGLRWGFSTIYSSNWHPLTWLSHMLDVTSFGMRPWGHHLTSLLLHAANSTLVFVLFRQMTGATWRSAAVAGLFALHPMHVESVAWVAERKDVLSAFFGLCSLLLYVRYARQTDQAADMTPAQTTRGPFGMRAGLWSYWAAFGFYAFGLMSKPMLVTWPFVLLLLDWWPLQRFVAGTPPAGANREANTKQPASKSSRGEGDGRGYARIRLRQLLVEKVPFLALSVASCLVTYYAQAKGEAIGTLIQYPLAARAANAVVSYARYLFKVFYPVKLSVFYPYSGHWPAMVTVMSLLLVAFLSWVALRSRRRQPQVLMGWLWFLGMLVPVIGLVQVGSQSMADRYVYLPFIGIACTAVWTAAWVFRSWRLPVGAGAAFAGSLLLISGLMTRWQASFWTNSEMLFRRAVAVTEKNALALNNLGEYLMRAIPPRDSEALELFRRALQIDDQDAGTWNNLGTVLADQKNYVDAISAYEIALRLRPNGAVIHRNFGSALEEAGRIQEAAAQFREAIRCAPGDAKGHSKLAHVLTLLNVYEEANLEYREALKLDPLDPEARNHFGAALMEQGQVDEAAREFAEVVKARPASAEAHNNLGAALLRSGKADAAIAQFRLALDLKADHAGAHCSLGVALAGQGKFDEAIRQVQEAVRLVPLDPQPRFNFGFVLSMQGQEAAAISQFQEALRLAPGLTPAREALAGAHVRLAARLAEEGQERAAIGHCQEALRLQPDQVDALRSLAWTLATSRDAGLRDGTQAIQFAEHLSRLQPAAPEALDTLAVAYAEQGRLAEAEATAVKALPLAATRGDPQLAKEIEEHLKTFRAGKPWRE